MPQPFARFDVVALAASLVALALWAALPQSIVAGSALLAAGAMQAVRLARWAGERAASDRLVLVLHVAYAFVPIGFVLLGLSVLDVFAISASAGLHAWTAGAIGLMTLAVMTRASLGHTGRPLRAGAGTQTIYLLVFCAAVLRILAGFAGSMPLVWLAALAWTAAFGGFAVLYGPLLCRKPPVWARRG